MHNSVLTHPITLLLKALEYLNPTTKFNMRREHYKVYKV